MGELPIFTSQAHVFTIDPKTKKTWNPSSQAAVEINYFFDPTKNCFRIVSIEDSTNGKKVIINSTLTEKMTFKKTSQKFGQWTDSKQSTIFGLGFNSEVDLDLFVEKFKECIDTMKKRSGLLLGDNGNNKETKREPLTINNNLIGVSNSGRQWSAPSSTSPNLNNNNLSKVASLEVELERMTKKFDDLKLQHQSEIKKIREELDHANTGALSSTVENYKCTKELRLRISELEVENAELKRKLSDVGDLRNSNLINNQIPSLLSIHQQMESVISQLHSCHFVIGQKLTDIVSSQTSDLNPPSSYGL